MQKDEALALVQEIARDVLDNESIILTYESTTDMVPDWDSLNHVQIITEIQNKLNIKFSAKEMISWDNIGDLCDSIINKK
jgi:acyl carrier protein